MFTKKKIIISAVSILLIAAVATGAILIASGGSAKVIVKEKYIKEGMPDITFKFNGEDILFSYDHTENVPMEKGRNLDGKEVYITTDHYVSKNGARATKYEDSDTFYFVCLDNSEETERIITDDEILKTACDAVNSSDFKVKADLSKSNRNNTVSTSYKTATTAEGKEIKTVQKYNARIRQESESIAVHMDACGKPYLISVTLAANADEKSKEVAQEKFDSWLAKKRSEGGKYVVEDVCYESRGNKNYAFFMFTYYPYAQSDNPTPETDAHSVYTVFCEL